MWADPWKGGKIYSPDKEEQDKWPNSLNMLLMK